MLGVDLEIYFKTDKKKEVSIGKKKFNKKARHCF